MTAENITPEEHSRVLGGSIAERRLHCPRSVYLEGLVPDVETDTAYTREGTALHEMMAVILSQGKDPDELLPFTYDRKDADGKVQWSFTVDRDLWLDKGQPALDRLDQFIERVEADWDGAPFEMLIEQRVAFPGVENSFGTSDIVGKCGRERFVIDWKFGRKPVQADENGQMMFYAVGAANSCSKFMGDMTPDTPFTLAIIQPMSDEDDIMSIWETDYAELTEMADALRAAVNEGLTKGAEATVAKGRGCTYCKAKPICPLYVSDTTAMVSKMQKLKAMQAEKEEFDNGGGPVDEPQPHTPDDFAAILGELLDLAGFVEEWASDVAQLAHDMAMAGTTIPGRKLVEKKGGSRTWAKGEEEVIKFFKNRKFTLDEYMPRKLVTMPQGEKLLKAAGKEVPEDMVSKPGVTGYKLVREGHPAEAYVPTTVQVGALAEKLSKITGGK